MLLVLPFVVVVTFVVAVVFVSLLVLCLFLFLLLFVFNMEIFKVIQQRFQQVYYTYTIYRG